MPDEHLGTVGAGRGEGTARDGHVVVQQGGLCGHGVADKARPLTQGLAGVHLDLQLRYVWMYWLGCDAGVVMTVTVQPALTTTPRLRPPAHYSHHKRIPTSFCLYIIHNSKATTSLVQRLLLVGPSGGRQRQVRLYKQNAPTTHTTPNMSCVNDFTNLLNTLVMLLKNTHCSVSRGHDHVNHGRSVQAFTRYKRVFTLEHIP